MPSVSFDGCPCSGHGGFPPRSGSGTAGTVLVNGIPAMVQGDPYGVHIFKKKFHAGSVAGGSATVFAEGRPLARIGDSVSCGSVIAQGSPNVFAGG
ncbi:MAG: hypothetical protein RLZZ373_3164 [Pseudomonadota bacterium]